MPAHEPLLSRIDLAANLLYPPEIPRSLIGGFFIEKNLNLVTGQPGSYKTMCMLEICSAIALGRPAFGLFPCEEGRVVFITGDDPAEIVVDRLLMLNSIEVGETRCIEPIVRKKLAQNIAVYPLDQVVSLRSRRMFAEMAAVLAGCAFAVLDPLRHFIGEADENKAHEIYREVEPIRRLANSLPCAIAVVHHSRKETQGADTSGKLNVGRGSGAIRGLSRAQINIERLNHGEKPPRINFVGENRYNGEPEELALEVAETVCGGLKLLQFHKPILAEMLVARLQVLKRPASTNELVDCFKEPASTIRQTLHRLKDKRLVTSFKDGKVSMWEAMIPAKETDPNAKKTKVVKRGAQAPITDEERRHTENL